MASDTTIETIHSTSPTRTNSIINESTSFEKQVGKGILDQNDESVVDQAAHIFPVLSTTKAVMLTLVVTCAMVLNVSHML